MEQGKEMQALLSSSSSSSSLSDECPANKRQELLRSNIFNKIKCKNCNREWMRSGYRTYTLTSQDKTPAFFSAKKKICLANECVALNFPITFYCSNCKEEVAHDKKADHLRSCCFNLNIAKFIPCKVELLLDNNLTAFQQLNFKTLLCSSNTFVIAFNHKQLEAQVKLPFNNNNPYILVPEFNADGTIDIVVSCEHQVFNTISVEYKKNVQSRIPQLSKQEMNQLCSSISINNEMIEVDENGKTALHNAFINYPMYALQVITNLKKKMNATNILRLLQQVDNNNKTPLHYLNEKITKCEQLKKKIGKLEEEKVKEEDIVEVYLTLYNVNYYNCLKWKKAEKIEILIDSIILYDFVKNESSFIEFPFNRIIPHKIENRIIFKYNENNNVLIIEMSLTEFSQCYSIVVQNLKLTEIPFEFKFDAEFDVEFNEMINNPKDEFEVDQYNRTRVSYLLAAGSLNCLRLMEEKLTHSQIKFLLLLKDVNNKNPFDFALPYLKDTNVANAIMKANSTLYAKVKSSLDSNQIKLIQRNSIINSLQVDSHCDDLNNEVLFSMPVNKNEIEQFLINANEGVQFDSCNRTLLHYILASENILQLFEQMNQKLNPHQIYHLLSLKDNNNENAATFACHHVKAEDKEEWKCSYNKFVNELHDKILNIEEPFYLATETNIEYWDSSWRFSSYTAASIVCFNTSVVVYKSEKQVKENDPAFEKTYCEYEADNALRIIKFYSIANDPHALVIKLKNEAMYNKWKEALKEPASFDKEDTSSHLDHYSAKKISSLEKATSSLVGVQIVQQNIVQ